MSSLRIGTRGSQLALAQSRWVADTLRQLHPGLQVELEIITTRGDRIQDVALNKVGGKGLFVKEIETALLDGVVDLAVHSMKDLPAELPDGLEIVCVPRREDPRDVLVIRDEPVTDRPVPLADGVLVGSSSLRRRAQLAHLRPDLRLEDIRGNVDTRLRKLDEGRYDAIVLAAAGLNRLGLADRVSAHLDPDLCIPAPAQGALAIEARAADSRVRELLAPLHHEPTAVMITAERSFLQRVEGGCQVPVGVLAEADGTDGIRVRGMIAAIDGSRRITDTVCGQQSAAADLGAQLGELLLAAGGRAILDDIERAADNGTQKGNGSDD